MADQEQPPVRDGECEICAERGILPSKAIACYCHSRLVMREVEYLRRALREALSLPDDAPDEDIIDHAFERLKPLPAARPEPPAAEPWMELHKAISRILDYRFHVSGCEINQTDFCTCGLREAVEGLDSAWKQARAAVHAQEGPRDGKEAAGAAGVQREGAAADASGAPSMAETARGRQNAQSGRGIGETPLTVASREDQTRHEG